MTTPCGRWRSFVKEGLDNFYTQALNTPIQGGEAEVLLASMATLHVTLDGLDAKMVNVVHDEIVVECAVENLNAVEMALKTAMESGMREVFPNAPLHGLVEVHHGPNWYAAKQS